MAQHNVQIKLAECARPDVGDVDKEHVQGKLNTMTKHQTAEYVLGGGWDNTL
jgi:hypothetical protein